MDVQIMVGKEIFGHAQPVRVGPYPGQRRLHRFLHNLANLPGHGESAFAFHGVGFDEEDVATGRSPGQAHTYSRAFRAFSDLTFAANLDTTQKFLNHILSDDQLLSLAPDEPRRRLAADSANGAF